MRFWNGIMTSGRIIMDKNKKPVVSVIIPTYNRAHYLTQAIQSVLDQSYQDFEIIVVDDGSTDNTREVMDSFKDPRLKYFYQENQGVCAARNNGINVSEGEYIYFLDSDDALLENALERQVGVLDRHPDVALSHGQAFPMDERGRVFGLHRHRPRNISPGVYHGIKEISNFLRYGNHSCLSATIIRRSSIIDVGLFDPAFRAGSEDFDLWVRLAKKYAVSYIVNHVVACRVHSSSMTASRALDEMEKSHNRILEGIFNDVSLGHLFSSQRAKTYFYYYLRLASYAYDRGKMKISRTYLFKALKTHPRALIESVFFPLLYLFVKTWIPGPVLRVLRRVRLGFRENQRPTRRSAD
jgi:glycosyltransferase involved in cell wall biosynthesis